MKILKSVVNQNKILAEVDQGIRVLLKKYFEKYFINYISFLSSVILFNMFKLKNYLKIFILITTHNPTLYCLRSAADFILRGKYEGRVLKVWGIRELESY